MRVLCIVGASIRRVWDAQPNKGSVEARRAYTGALFRLAVRYAERFYPNSWVVLSPSMGYLFPYEKIVDREHVDPRDIMGEGNISMLRSQAIMKSIYSYKVAVVIGGKVYADLAKASLVRTKIYFPLRRLRYGEKLRIIKQALAKNTPLPLDEEYTG